MKNKKPTMFEASKKQGFIYAEHAELYTYAADPDQLLNFMLAHQRPEGLERWMARDSMIDNPESKNTHPSRTPVQKPY